MSPLQTVTSCHQEQGVKQKVPSQFWKAAYFQDDLEIISERIESQELKTTVAINKDIIKSILAGESPEALMEQETAALTAALRRVTEERDQALARLFIAQQIMDNTKDKEEDVAEIFRDEIEELKENLERKEYLLQVNE